MGKHICTENEDEPHVAILLASFLHISQGYALDNGADVVAV